MTDYTLDDARAVAAEQGEKYSKPGDRTAAEIAADMEQTLRAAELIVRIWELEEEWEGDRNE